jgi:hypothetical protein
MMPCAYEPRPPAYEPDSMGPRGGWAKQGRATLTKPRHQFRSFYNPKRGKNKVIKQTQRNLVVRGR